MGDAARQQLMQAYQLIKSGQRDQAIEILLPALKADESNVDAWWLLANALSSPEDIREALETVLALRPGHEPARKMLDRLGPRPEPAASAAGFDDDEADEADDLFADLKDGGEDPFAGLDVPKPAAKAATSRAEARPRATPKSGSNRVWWIIGSVILLAVVLIGGALVVLQNLASQAVQQVLVNVTFESGGVGGDLNSLIGDLNMQGSISLGQTARGAVADAFDNHGYTFSGQAGQTITIEAGPDGSDLTTELSLFDPSDQRLAEDTDMGSGSSSGARVQVTLPTTGAYTIVVSGLASSGAYTLTVR